ncbi:RNA polymerase subunit AC19, partial [Nowakowskiella sp. JEL0078]
PNVDFCGYSLPHPSESKMHMRIQTDGTVSAVDVLNKGLDDLIELVNHIRNIFHQRSEEGNFEVEEGAEFVLEELDDLMDE